LTEAVTKLSYNAALRRVRFEFNRRAAKTTPEPSPDLMSRATDKMLSVQKEGDIDFFLTYEKQLQQSWARLALKDEWPDERTISLTLAAGAPRLAQTSIEKSKSPKALFEINMKLSSQEVKSLQYDTFRELILKLAKEAGIQTLISHAQTQSLFLRAQTGQLIKSWAINPLPQIENAKAFNILANKNRKEITLLITSPEPLQDKASCDAMLAALNGAIKSANAAPQGASNYKVVKNDFLNVLQQIRRGPESLGLGLPVTILAAVGSRDESKATSTKSRTSKMENYPGKGYLDAKISDDKMSVEITDFDIALYDQTEFPIDLDWIEKELKTLRINVRVANEAKRDLGQLIQKKEDLTGQILARGQPGTPGSGAFLYEAYKDVETKVNDIDEATLDIRALQQRSMVKTGQLVAVLKYKQNAAKGSNVFGKPIAPPEAEENLEVIVGDGIEKRDDGRFYALFDGIPEINNGSIWLNKKLVQKGDVNLRSGNIDFDGVVEIEGSIDAGSTVVTTNDLIVHGTIRDGSIKVGGNLIAHSGITTGESGKILVRGDVSAQFVENSNLVCGGTLIVTKALLNSHVIVGESITIVSPEGTLAGGNISCRDTITAANVGFAKGSITHLNVGVDFRVEMAVAIRRGRIAKLESANEENRTELRELAKKRGAQLTARHKEMKTQIQAKLQKIKSVMAKAQNHLDAAKGLLSYNKDSKVVVANLLTSRVKPVMAGNVVNIPSDVVAVVITAHRHRGSFIESISEPKQAS
jgi:uncharacterized protein (DUF342 family)